MNWILMSCCMHTMEFGLQVNNIVFMNANRTYCLLIISSFTYDYLKEQKGLAAEWVKTYFNYLEGSSFWLFSMFSYGWDYNKSDICIFLASK